MKTSTKTISRSVLVLLGAVGFFLCDRPGFARGISPTASTEGRQVREGTVEILFADNFEAGSSRLLYDLVTAEGERISLRPDRAASLSNMKRGERVRVTGRFVAGEMIVERAERLSAKGAETAAMTSAWTTGPKKAIAILVNFLDDTSQPYTVAEAQNTMFGPQGSNVATYWGEVSFGQTTITSRTAGTSSGQATTCSSRPPATAPTR